MSLICCAVLSVLCCSTLCHWEPPKETLDTVNSTTRALQLTAILEAHAPRTVLNTNHAYSLGPLAAVMGRRAQAIQLAGTGSEAH